MKLTASMMLTVDGVYQGPGGSDEDRRGGFERGGWTAAHADPEMWPFLTSWFERADALLLGRKTWEIWEPYWPLHGSGVLLRWLLERDVVDELNLRVYPVIVGDGLRLFPEHGQTHDLELVDSRSTSKGVMIQTYRPNGRAILGPAG